MHVEGPIFVERFAAHYRNELTTKGTDRGTGPGGDDNIERRLAKIPEPGRLAHQSADCIGIQQGDRAVRRERDQELWQGHADAELRNRMCRKRRGDVQPPIALRNHNERTKQHNVWRPEQCEDLIRQRADIKGGFRAGEIRNGDQRWAPQPHRYAADARQYVRYREA